MGFYVYIVHKLLNYVVRAGPLIKVPMYMVGIRFQSHMQVEFTHYPLQIPPLVSVRSISKDRQSI